MRKLFFSMLILVAALVACNKENSTSSSGLQSIAASSLPVTVSDYVANNYPAETITSALKVSNSAATYIVTLNTLEELAFNGHGDFIGNGEDYHHHGDSLGGRPCDSLGFHGHHGGHGGHGGPGGPGEHGNSISVDSLPATIGDYLAANYSGYTARHAEIDTLCQFGGVYEVMIDQSGNTHLKLLFDAAGTYLAKAERARYTDAPQAVKDYITANYAGYNTRDKMEKFTLADSSLQYSIFLALEGSRKNVILRADGTFVCEK